jgi:hypothetical protein
MKNIGLQDVCPDKCKTCQYPTPIVYDHLIGEPIASNKSPESVYADIKEMESKTLENVGNTWNRI